jgi:phenylacetate-CoA ligase
MPVSAPPPQRSLPQPDGWAELTASVRLPGLSAQGEAMLARLRGHPAAPIYRNFSGHRLSRRDQWWARLQHIWLRSAATQMSVGPALPPAWIWPWLLRHHESVAAWPEPTRWLQGWQNLPTTNRADLQARLAWHVPRQRQNSALLCFSTSGTTGHPIRVPSTPLAAAAYQALHERALALHGVRLIAAAGDVGVVLAGFQRRCFTYVSVNPLRGECGLAKLNLNPEDWRQADDRVRYLDDLQSELISGDPVSLVELARLPLVHKPRALLSTSMALSEGLRQQLEARFSCPVVDVYSLNEVGPVAAYVAAARGHVLLQPRLYVEILGKTGVVLPEGELGEVTVSGGINPCLPLLRYRTGDWARLVNTGFGPTLMDLQGRPPVRFLSVDGRWINNVELTQALSRFSLRRFALHQCADRSLHLRVDGGLLTPTLAELAATLRFELEGLLGELPLRIDALCADDKLVQYTSDLPQAQLL